MTDHALFIGRFQPFHNGHISALNAITEAQIIIGVGSSQYSGTDENPFSFEQRKQMIEHALPKELMDRCRIVPIPDIHDAPNWVAHVESLIGKEYVVYTGNDLTKELFEQKGYTVKQALFDIPISGTTIRDMLKNKQTGWQQYIPKENQALVAHYYEL